MSDGRVNPPGGEIVVYEDQDGAVRVDALLDHDTVWLSLTQMAEHISARQVGCFQAL